MLDSITIKNFKAITQLTLKDLASVNYLVGKNGCGKSSVLEPLDLIVTIKDSKNVSSIENLKYDKINLAHFNISTQQLNDIENNLKIELNAKITFGEYKFSFIVENKKIDLVEPKDHKIGIYKIDSFNNKKSYGRFNGEKIIINSNNISEFIERIDLDLIKSPIILEEQGIKENILSGLDLTLAENQEYINRPSIKDKYKGQQYTAKFSFGQNLIFDMCKEIKSLFKQVLIHDESDLIIIFIEEPETGLHPEFQKLIPAIFEHFIKDVTKNIKFIILTHSPFIISAAAEISQNEFLELKQLHENSSKAAKDLKQLFKPSQKIYKIEEGNCKNPFGSWGVDAVFESAKMLGAHMQLLNNYTDNIDFQEHLLRVMDKMVTHDLKQKV